MSFLKFWTTNNDEMPSSKVLEKFKHSIHGLEKGTECKEEEFLEKKEENGGDIADDDVILDYTMDYLTPELLEEARTELNETEETKQQNLELLRELIRNEPNLVCPMHDNYLLAFLRARKHNVKKAFKNVQHYWHFRKEHKEMYDTSDSDIVKKLILKNFVGFLTKRDRKGCVVLILKVGRWDPDVDDYDDLCRAITAILIHSIQFEVTQIAGYRVIFDVRELSWTQVKMCTPSNMLLMVHSTQDCFPARYKGIHVLTENKLFNLTWAMIHHFFPMKVKKRIQMHDKDLSPLQEYIHPSILPVEYGGEAPPFDNSSWAKILDDNTELVMDQLNYGYKD